MLRAFTYAELAGAACEHRQAQLDCPACIRRIFWREGRRDGIREVGDLASTMALEAWRATVEKELISA